MARTLVAVLLVLVLAALGVWWWGRPATSPADDRALVPAPERTAEPASARAPASTERAPADGSATVDALWRDGRVVLPAGTPDDERVVVVARSSARFDGRPLDEAREERVVADPDGSFRVAFAPGSLRGWVRLEARYLHLDERVKVDLAAEPTPLEIRPWLGARLVGRVVGAGGEALDDETLAGLRVRLWRDGGASGLPGGELPLDGDGFEWNALDPAVVYSVQVRGEGLRPCGVDDLRLRAGETRELLLEEPPAPKAEAPFESDLTISGHVRWADGRPAAGVVVLAELEGADAQATGSPEIEARTDAEGAFVLEGLVPWRYLLTAFELTSAGEPGVSAALRDVQAGTSGHLLVLDDGPLVTGRVLDGEDRPVTRFAIVASPRDRRREEVRRSFEDGQGRFEVETLATGEWTLQVEADGLRSLGTKRVTAPDGAQDVVLRLLRPARIAGVVLSADGEPVGRARVEVRPDPRGFYSGVQPWNDRADREGRFEVDGLQPGRVLVVARATGHGANALLTLDLAPGEAREELELVLTAPGRITVELDPSIEPRRGRPVAAFPASVPGLLDTLDMKRSQTDGEGRAEFKDLAAGTYEVAYLEDMGSSPRPEHTARVTLAAGGFAHVVLGASDERPVVLHGVVRDGWTPRGGVAVSVLSAAGARRRRVGAVTTDAEGRYELELPAPGRVIVTLSIDGAEVGGARFEVPAVDRFQQPLFLGRARISGVVVDEAGAPLAGIQLLLTGAEQIEDRLVESDAQGRFEIEHLPAGWLTLRYGQPFRRGDPALERYGRRVEVVALDPEGAAELHLVLRTAGAVEGRVLRADGSAPPFCRIEARDANDVLLDRLVFRVADPTGRFRIRGLDPGPVQLRAVTEEREGPWKEVLVLPDETVAVVLEL